MYRIGSAPLLYRKGLLQPASTPAHSQQIRTWLNAQCDFFVNSTGQYGSTFTTVRGAFGYVLHALRSLTGTPDAMIEKYRYEEFTWPEIRHAVAEQRVAVLPVGTVEQHGPHLPLVTDVLTATEMSRRAVEHIATEAVLMPSVYYSFNEHHLDFPGTIAVQGETIVNYVTDVGLSLAHHGFRKILLVNGHGSNVPFLDIAARNITNRSEAVCAMVPWWSLIPRPLLEQLRESEYPGGMAHGCELETSVLMHLRPDLVQIDKAEKDISFQPTEFFYWDLQSPSPVFFQEWFSRYSRTGTVGDPTVATAEKGRQFVEAVVERLIVLIREFRARKIAPRVDHH